MQQTERDAGGRHVVIVGGGFAGLGAAFALRERLPKTERVSVFSPSWQFTFAPSLIWSSFGQPVLRSSFALQPTLESKGIAFVRNSVREIDPDKRVIHTDDGEIAYDCLLIATGGRPDAGRIPGLAGEFQSANWIVGEDSAREAAELLSKLYEQPGPAIVGVAPDAPYMSAAYEFALNLDWMLRSRGLREKVPLTFVTAEPFLGHLGFGQTAARSRLDALFAERDISVRLGAEIERVQRDGVLLVGGEKLSATAMLIMPPFTGAVDIWKTPELSSDKGFVPVDRDYRHVQFPDIYAAGVASEFQQELPPLGARRAPQTGYLSLQMGQIAGQNIAASLGFGQSSTHPLPYVLDVRILDGGDRGLFLASTGRHALRNFAQILPGRSGHFLKSLLERYLVWRLRTGKIHLP